MRILLIGKVASVTHWLEDCEAAWRADGHSVRTAATRNPAISRIVESLMLSPALGAPLAARVVRTAKAFSPDLIVAVGAYHVPATVLERLAALQGRPPMVGWVGDLFTPEAARSAGFLDAVFYTDQGLKARHAELGLTTPAGYLPHAADPRAAQPPSASRRRRMIFIANPTGHRRRIVAGVSDPIVIHGPGWTEADRGVHELHAGRATPSEVHQLYAGHLAALNIHNELNVLTGLNQRNFEPYVTETPVVAEHQADLEACFDPGEEVLVYRNTEELNDIHQRLLADPDMAVRIGRAGRARLLAEHTFGARLRALASPP